MTCILAALDFANDSQHVLEHAAKLAKILDIDLVLATVDNEAHSPTHPIYALEKQYQQQGLRCRALLLQGEIAKEVIACTNEINAEMLVIGSHGNSSIHDILHGHAGPDILQGSSKPVLVIPNIIA